MINIPLLHHFVAIDCLIFFAIMQNEVVIFVKNSVNTILPLLLMYLRRQAIFTDYFIFPQNYSAIKG